MSELNWLPPSIQTPNERLIYTLTTTNWGATPSNVSIKAYDTSQEDKDVTNTVFPDNEPSVDTNTISLSLLRALTANHVYRIEYQFDVTGSTLEARKEVRCVPYYVIRKPVYQSSSESVAYAINMANRVTSPTSATIYAYDEMGDKDVTATIISDSTPTPSGNNIPVIVGSLTRNHSYRIAVRVVKSTQIWEPSFQVKCGF